MNTFRTTCTRKTRCFWCYFINVVTTSCVCACVCKCALFLLSLLQALKCGARHHKNQSRLKNLCAFNNLVDIAHAINYIKRHEKRECITQINSTFSAF